jgi:hypothetical protein
MHGRIVDGGWTLNKNNPWMHGIVTLGVVASSSTVGRTTALHGHLPRSGMQLELEGGRPS